MSLSLLSLPPSSHALHYLTSSAFLPSGVDLSSPDSQGNTALHFAAKYGHAELCKHLIDQGSKAGEMNSQRQTAYDVAESHIVRQFLLPLVLASEREREGYQPYSNQGMQMERAGGNMSTSSMHSGTGSAQSLASSSRDSVASAQSMTSNPPGPPASAGVNAGPPMGTAAPPPTGLPGGVGGGNMFRNPAVNYPSYVVPGAYSANVTQVPAPSSGGGGGGDIGSSSSSGFSGSGSVSGGGGGLGAIPPPASYAAPAVAVPSSAPLATAHAPAPAPTPVPVVVQAHGNMFTQPAHALPPTAPQAFAPAHQPPAQHPTMPVYTQSLAPAQAPTFQPFSYQAAPPLAPHHPAEGILPAHSYVKPEVRGSSTPSRIITPGESCE